MVTVELNSCTFHNCDLVIASHSTVVGMTCLSPHPCPPGLFRTQQHQTVPQSSGNYPGKHVRALYVVYNTRSKVCMGDIRL